jgi:hypothetical protein
MYSKGLRDLIGKMLNVKPQQRPSILDICNKMIVRKRLIQYFNDCLNGSPQDLAATDVDDLFLDGLREQAEFLQIPGFAVDDGGKLGMMPGGKALAGAVNTKKIKQLRDVE